MSNKKFSNPFTATLNGIIELYSSKGENVVLPDAHDLSGKHIMITGSSAGLGLATAIRVAKAGAQLSMAVRSGIPDKGQWVEQQSGTSGVQMYHVDLSDFESINAFLDQLQQEGVKLDIFIANAAMVPLESRQTEQGIEEMFMVNYLSSFYLINHLLSRKIIDASRSQKIIIISSESHRDPTAFDWDGFGKYQPYGIKDVIAKYGYYKLLLTTFANELARRINVEAITTIPVRVLCPGPVNSNIAREAPSWMQPLLKGVFSLFFRSPEKAADPVIYFCQEQEDKPIDYLYLLQKKAMAPLTQEQSNGKILWERSEELLRELGYPLD